MNRLWINGEIAETQPLRFSPAGVPIAEAVIAHAARVELVSGARDTACDLTVQASGEVAAELARLPKGIRVKLEGALTRKSLNSRQLILIVNRIEKE